jgi:hypothetical protein
LGKCPEGDPIFVGFRYLKVEPVGNEPLHFCESGDERKLLSTLDPHVVLRSVSTYHLDSVRAGPLGPAC